MSYKYCVAENWGKGFIEAHESRDIGFTGLPANVWKLPINTLVYVDGTQGWLLTSK